MKTIESTLLCVVATLASALAGPTAHAASFQHGVAVEPNGKPLEFGVWYTSQSVPQPVTVGLTTMSVALNGPVKGTALKLVVISHGTGGSFIGHHETAIGLHSTQALVRQ